MGLAKDFRNNGLAYYGASRMAYRNSVSTACITPRLSKSKDFYFSMSLGTRNEDL